jgi:hypothetical protein
LIIGKGGEPARVPVRFAAGVDGAEHEDVQAIFAAIERLGGGAFLSVGGQEPTTDSASSIDDRCRSTGASPT